jgi:hypothetical protein
MEGPFTTTMRGVAEDLAAFHRERKEGFRRLLGDLVAAREVREGEVREMLGAARERLGEVRDELREKAEEDRDARQKYVDDLRTATRRFRRDFRRVMKNMAKEQAEARKVAVSELRTGTHNLLGLVRLGLERRREEWADIAQDIRSGLEILRGTRASRFGLAFRPTVVPRPRQKSEPPSRKRTARPARKR